MFSQNNEEQVIGDYFAAHGVGTRRFLDLGAHDGQQFSNSRALALAGWSGVLMEPAPGPFLALLDRYGGQDGFLLVNAAIAATAGLVVFHDANGDMVGSMDTVHVYKWSTIVKFRQFTVCAITPAMLLDYVGTEFDFINLDVEGMSADLFHLLVDAGAKARCWCIEHDGRADEIVERCGTMRLSELSRNGENIIVGAIA